MLYYMTNASDQDQGGETKPSGRLADLVRVQDTSEKGPGFNPTILIPIAILAGLFVWLNFWRIHSLVLNGWLNDPNWSHGFIIPIFSLFLIYNRRDDLLTVEARPCVWALPLLILSLLGQILCVHPIHNVWLGELSMVASLFFLVLYLSGPGVIRVTWLPILYLALAMPIPGYLYTKISVPLQELAAQGSALILQICGKSIDVTASHLKIISESGQTRELTVAEACSGMRSLMAYVALGVAWAYLEERPAWQRVILVLAVIPVAVLCNVLRVTITSTAYVYDHPELGQKFMHTFTGLLMLIPALLMFLLLSWLLKHLFIEHDEHDEDDQTDTRSSVREAEA